MVIENNMMLRIFFLITWGLLEAMASLNTSDENVKLINILLSFWDLLYRILN